MSITAVAGLTLLATGCGKSPSEFVAERVIEQQTDGEVDVDFNDGGIDVQTADGEFSVDEDGSFTVTDGNGETVVGVGDSDGNFTVDGDDGSFTMSQGGEIPAEWPEEIPRPEGVTVAGSSVVDTGDGTGITLAGTPAEADSFLADYGATLEAAGLSQMSEYSTPESAAAVYGNDSWTISIGTTTFDDGIQLSISLFPAG